MKKLNPLMLEQNILTDDDINKSILRSDRIDRWDLIRPLKSKVKNPLNIDPYLSSFYFLVMVINVIKVLKGLLK